MAYKKIKSYKFTEDELRQIWQEEYCSQKIFTFDNIEVKFFPEMFDHCFYESANRKKKDKSILSLNRLEKIYWIKETLQDKDALLKQGWIKKNKSYTNSRRVTLVKGNYIVVILIFKKNKARFITAYEIDNDENLEDIKSSPDWT